MRYTRFLKQPSKSFFLFGPRGTGKTTWLKEQLPKDMIYIDFLRSSVFLEYKRDPGQLRRVVRALKKGTWVVLDEIQKIPELLDEVQSILFDFKNQYRFVLSGSSARKLKKSQANLLAGRAVTKKMYPLLSGELKEDFHLNQVLRYGQLPEVFLVKDESEKIEFLNAYVETYLAEEIRQEALTRNLNAFYRFLNIIAVVHGKILNVNNISREVGLARSTVQGYFEILVDTLMGWYLPSFRLRAKIKEVQHPKFYLFDCGIQRALAGFLREVPRADECGFLFETWFINELRALNHIFSFGGRFFYWRTVSGNEVDLIIECGRKRIAFELKYSMRWKKEFQKGLVTLLESGKIQKGYGIYCGKHRLQEGPVVIFPYREAIKEFLKGNLF